MNSSIRACTSAVEPQFYTPTLNSTPVSPQALGWEQPKHRPEVAPQSPKIFFPKKHQKHSKCMPGRRRFFWRKGPDKTVSRETCLLRACPLTGHGVRRSKGSSRSSNDSQNVGFPSDSGPQATRSALTSHQGRLQSSLSSFHHASFSHPLQRPPREFPQYSSSERPWLLLQFQ